MEQAATYLRRLIFAEELPAGARVPQDDVARALGITRIPVREALHVLELEGRVRIEPNRRAYVAAVTEQSARDAIDLLSVIHGFAARRMIERATPELIKDLAAANRRVQDTTDLVELYYAFDSFQDLIVTGGLGTRLAVFIRRLRQLSPDTLYEQEPTLAALIKQTANRTFRALKQGDGDRVEEVVHTSHATILARLVPLLRNDGLMSD